MKKLKLTLFFVLPSTGVQALGAAVGIGVPYYSKAYYGDVTYLQPAIEGIFYAYSNLKGSLDLRGGLKGSYAWLQPSMPKGLRIEEHDMRFSADIGVVLNWVAIPSFSGGAGILIRSRETITGSTIFQDSDSLSGVDGLGFLYAQAGIGLPFFQGFMVLEPYIRYTYMPEDLRFDFAYGAECTFEIF
jgi:hypothetical protein